MIIPQTRLMFWIGLILMLFFTLFGIFPEMLGLTLFFVAGIIIISLIDAILSYSLIKHINIEMPDIIRLIRGRQSKFVIKFIKSKKVDMSIILAIGFPQEIIPAEKIIDISMNSIDENLVFEILCSGALNGKYYISISYLHILSRFGFWNIRKIINNNVEIRVYPDIKNESRQLAGLFTRQSGVGIHISRQYGKGRDFEKLREYIQGDSYEDIHWKITAKRGKPVTKIFQVERTQEVYVIVDSSRLSSRKIPELRKILELKNVKKNNLAQNKENVEITDTAIIDRFITSALITGLAVEKQGDLFGLIISNDKTENFVRAGRGKRHYNICRNILYDIKPKIVSPDYEQLFNFLSLNIRRRALLIILTNLDEPIIAENFIDGIKAISGKHLVCVNMLKNLSLHPFFNEGPVNTIDEIYQNLGSHIAWKGINDIEKIFLRQGVYFKLLNNYSFSADIVGQYVDIKKRQLI